MAHPRTVAMAFQIAIPHHERIVRGIMDYSRRHGPWELAFSPEASQVSLDSLEDWDGDGVLALIERPEQIRIAAHLRCPVVNLSAALEDTGLPTVTSDNRQVGHVAADHLLGRGFRRFAYYGLKDVWYSEERCRGFRERIEVAGPHCDVWSTTSSLFSDRPWSWDRAGLAGWLRGLSPPVGILAAHDYRARMVLEACQLLDLHVPRDVAIVGVNDDLLACESSVPSLTSVAQDGERIGFEAAALLDQLMAGRRPPSRSILVAPRALVPRASTDTIAVSDPTLRLAIAEIHQRLDRIFGVEAIAKECGVSRRWLEQLFRTHVGCTPHEFIDRARVDRARELLATQPTLPLCDVARLCGFRDSRRLNLAFRRVLDLSPRECRGKA